MWPGRPVFIFYFLFSKYIANENEKLRVRVLWVFVHAFVYIYQRNGREMEGEGGYLISFAPTNWKSIYHPIPQLPVFEVLAGILLRESLSWHAYAKRLWTIVPCAWSTLMFSSLGWMNLFFDTRFQKNLESWARTGKIPKVPQVLLGFQRFW